MNAQTAVLPYRHSAFGLTIASQIALPELPQVQGDVEADVFVSLGEVSPILADAQKVERDILARPGALLMDFDTARYLVRNGSDITVQPGATATDREVRTYLLGSAMGALLLQRGLLPLHANVVEIDGRAIAFAGPSGSGKSTLAAYFRGRDRRLLCDDVCAVSFTPEGEAMAWPGVPRIKLWTDALAAFGHRPDDLERVVNWEEKYSLPLALEASTPFPLSSIYLLKAVETEPRITALIGAAAFDALASNIYRSEFAAPLGRAETVFASTLALLKTVDVFVAERRLGFDIFEREAANLERHVAGQPTRRRATVSTNWEVQS